MLTGDDTVYQLKEKTWAKVYVVIHIIIVILIIAQLATPKWVEIGTSGYIKGGILECNEGCGGKKTYQELYDDYCGSSSDDYYYSEESSEFSQEICESFESLAKAGPTKIALDIVTIFFIALWSATMFIFPKFRCIGSFNFFFSFLSFLFYFAGTASWLIRSGAKFGRNYRGVEARDSPRLSLVILVILFASVNFYAYINRVLYRRRRFKQFNKDHRVFEPTRVISNVAQPQNNIVMPPPFVTLMPMPQSVVYSQVPPAYGQPVYGQPVYGQPIYAQPVPAGFSNPANNYHNPNINDGNIKNLEENDLTVIDSTRKNN